MSFQLTLTFRNIRANVKLIIYSNLMGDINIGQKMTPSLWIAMINVHVSKWRAPCRYGEDHLEKETAYAKRQRHRKVCWKVTHRSKTQMRHSWLSLTLNQHLFFQGGLSGFADNFLLHYPVLWNTKEWSPPSNLKFNTFESWWSYTKKYNLHEQKNH